MHAMTVVVVTCLTVGLSLFGVFTELFQRPTAEAVMLAVVGSLLWPLLFLNLAFFVPGFALWWVSCCDSRASCRM